MSGQWEQTFYCLNMLFSEFGHCQIYRFKPVQMTVSTVFLLLLTYSVGNAWAKFLPTRVKVEGTRLSFLSRIIGIVNPGPFTLKEVR